MKKNIIISALGLIAFASCNKKATQVSTSNNNEATQQSQLPVHGTDPIPSGEKVRVLPGKRTAYGNGVYLCNGPKGICVIICSPSNSEEVENKTIYSATDANAQLEYREYTSENEYIVSFAKKLIFEPVANGVTYYPTN